MIHPTFVAMKWHSSHILSISSLVILSGFIGFWLYNSYYDERSALQKELYYHFGKASQEVKDSIFQAMIKVIDTSYVEHIQGEPDTLINITIKPTIKNRKLIIADSLKSRKEFFTSSEFKLFIADSENNQTKFSHDSSVTIDIVRPQDGEFNIFSFSEVASTELTSVEENFQNRIIKAGLPSTYMVLETFDSTLIKDGLSIVINKINPVHGQTSIAKFEAYQGYLIKRMWLQILFGFFLFSVVAIALYISNLRYRELRKLADMKNDFVSNMTHELKTPISTVSVAIEAMKNFEVLHDKERTEEYLDISKNELNRLTLLVDKVLKMSQFDNNYGHLDKMKELSLADVVQSVSDSMKLQLEKYHASLFVELEEGDFKIMGDRVHITNIIYNLVDNALKYGGSKPKIWIKIQEEMDKIILKVRDSGIGIRKENQDKIFDKFFRIPTGNTHNIKGYGLGLSYVAGVVKAHGGEIKVESKENEGSEFTINLPKHV